MNRLARTSRVVSIVALLAAVGGVGGAGAMAQPRNPGDGHALDANLRVGSGGRNEKVRDYDALKRFNDAVIYGQAGGGKSFRDTSVESRDPFEFRGALGTDDQYRFRRDTASAALVSRGIRSSDALSYQMALSSGQPVAPPLSAALLPQRDGRVSSGVSLAAMRSMTQFEWEQSRRPSVLGYASSATGKARVLTASPLRGLASSYAVDDNGDLVLTGMERTPPSIARVQDMRKSSTSVTRPVSNRLDAKVETRVSAYDDAMKRLKDEGGFKDEIQPPALTPDGKPVEPKPGDIKPGDLRPGETRPGELPGASATPTKPAWERDLDDLRERLRARAAAAAAAAKVDVPADDARAAEEKKATDARVQRMVDLLKKMRADNAVNDLGGAGAPGLYNDVLIEGQKQLGAGQYFDAEAIFSRILSAHPTDAMCAAGRMHAQLGAGAYVSAANSLRLLFEQHPEVIPMRYTGHAMIPAARVDEIATSLSATVVDPDSRMTADAGLLLAYLGFQRDNKAWLTAGLEALAKQTPEGTPNHELTKLVTDVWTGEVKPIGPRPEDPPAAPVPVPVPAIPPAEAPNK